MLAENQPYKILLGAILGAVFSLNRPICARFGVMCFIYYTIEDPIQYHISYLFKPSTFMLKGKSTEEVKATTEEKGESYLLAGLFHFKHSAAAA